MSGGGATGAGATAGGYMTGFQPGQMLATGMIGSYVYGPNNETIGDVNDFVLDRDGKIAAAVIGVGGFLGVGERNVAVPFAQIRMQERDGRSTLTLNATKDQLQQAPAFDRSRRG